MYRRCFEFIRTLEPEKLDVLEISGGYQMEAYLQDPFIQRKPISVL